MSHIPESWLAPVEEYRHMTLINAMKWCLDWYTQEKVKVLLEIAECKKKIKDCQIDNEVYAIDLYDPMSRLKEGVGKKADWNTYDELGSKINNNIMDIQDQFVILTDCRHHLMVLMNLIAKAKEDVEDAVALDKMAEADNET